MATTFQVRNAIREIEGFDVSISRSGIVVGDDDEIGEDYRSLVQRPSQDRTTASRWSRNRFRPFYPSYDVMVLLPQGDATSGKMVLGTIRRQYPDPQRSEKILKNIVNVAVDVLWRYLK
jgi:hypothetical protein